MKLTDSLTDTLLSASEWSCARAILVSVVRDLVSHCEAVVSDAHDARDRAYGYGRKAGAREYARESATMGEKCAQIAHYENLISALDGPTPYRAAKEVISLTEDNPRSREELGMHIAELLIKLASL